MDDDVFGGEGLLQGAGEIAMEIFGSNRSAERRRVYNLVKRGELPIFYLGGILVARRGTLRGILRAREDAALASALRIGGPAPTGAP